MLQINKVTQNRVKNLKRNLAIEFLLPDSSLNFSQMLARNLNAMIVKEMLFRVGMIIGRLNHRIG